MKRIFLIVITLSFLTGCATETLKAPCPNYGVFCNKTAINSWDHR